MGLCVLDMWHIFSRTKDVTLVKISLRMTVTLSDMITEVFYSRNYTNYARNVRNYTKYAITSAVV
jgi:hypothetical protein